MKDRQATQNKPLERITPLEVNRRAFIEMGLTPPSAISTEALNGLPKTTHQPGIPMTEYKRGPVQTGCFSQTLEGNPCKAYPIKGTHICAGHKKQQGD